MIPLAEMGLWFRGAIDSRNTSTLNNMKEIEKIVLGTALNDSGYAQSLMDALDPSVFSPEARPVFDVIRDVSNRISSPRLSDYAFSGGDHSESIITLSEVHAPDQFEDAIKKIAADYRNSKAIQELEQALAAAKRSGDSAYEVISGVGDRISAIGDEVRAQDIMDSKSLDRKAFEIMSRRREIGSEYIGVPCKWKQFTRLQNSFISGMYIVLSRPGQGKTSIALDLSRQFLELGYKPAFISLEMSLVSVRFRMVRSALKTTMENLQLGRLTDAQVSAWRDLMDSDQEGMSMVGDRQIYYEDLPEILRRLKRRGVKAVFIDYIQLITSRASYKNRYEELDTIANGISRLAIQYDMPIICMSQASRDVDKRPDKQPGMADNSDCSAIEKAAHCVMSIFRPSYYGIRTDGDGNRMPENYVRLKIVKARELYDGSIHLLYDHETGRYLEVAPPSETSFQDRPRDTSDPF